MIVTINKWGNSLGLRIPKIIAEKAKLSPGKELTITLTEDGQLLLKIREDKLTLADLVEGVKPENRHDLIIDDEVGQEKWDY